MCFVDFDIELTYGMVEMGGASTQIAAYENNEDLMVSCEEDQR